MAFTNIMGSDVPNVKPKYSALAPTGDALPRYCLGLIPTSHALRRMAHFHYDTQAKALFQLQQWQGKRTFLEGKVYLDKPGLTAIATAFFLDVLPPQATLSEGQTYAQIGQYPYLESSCVLLAEENCGDDFDDLSTPPYLATDVSRQVTGIYPAIWQLTDITTDLDQLVKLVEEADQADYAEEKPPNKSSCPQRHEQLTTLASALYRTQYTIRRYTKRGKWDSVSWVYYLEPLELLELLYRKGKRFALEVKNFDNPAPWHRPPYTFLTVTSSYSFADPVVHRTMITLWNAAHTPTRHACVAKKFPKLLQRGFGRRRK